MEHKVYEIECIGDSKKKIFVSEVLIDYEYVETYGHKTTIDGKRHYWRIAGELVIATNDDPEPVKRVVTRFKCNLADREGETLASRLNYFHKRLQNKEVVYEIKTAGSWKTAERVIEYDGYFELRFKKTTVLKSIESLIR